MELRLAKRDTHNATMLDQAQGDREYGQDRRENSR
jgi:hypothetical protein